jgi:hypothetical protein
MKKVSVHRYTILASIAKRRWKNRVLRKKRKKPVIGKYIVVGGRRFRDIIIPTQLDFSDHKEETLKFIRMFRESALAPIEKFRLNFGKLEGISPAASIVLLAEIYRCWKLNKKKVPASPIQRCKIAGQLEEMGFYELLEAPRVRLNLPLPSQEENKVYIKFATAVKDDGLQADKIRKAVFEECPESFSEESRDKIYRGLLECMSNVSRHAYSEAYKAYIDFPHSDRRWWMSGYVDKTKGEVLIQFFDQGAGISNTLLTRTGEKISHTLGSLVDKNPHATLIKRATEEGQSGTKQPNRGKGLPEIVNVTKNNHGRLRIISHKGEYKIYNENGSFEEILEDNPLSLGGTLIQWRVSAR